MKRGRKELAIPTVRWEVQVDVLLAADVELLIADPVSKKASYGERSKLVNLLLRQYLNERKSGMFVEFKVMPDQVEMLMKLNPQDVTLNLKTSVVKMPRSLAQTLRWGPFAAQAEVSGT